MKRTQHNRSNAKHKIKRMSNDEQLSGLKRNSSATLKGGMAGGVPPFFVWEVAFKFYTKNFMKSWQANDKRIGHGFPLKTSGDIAY